MPLVNESARVIRNVCEGPGLYILRVEAPKISGSILPGQFVHMKVPNMEGHILRRPFSVFARCAEEGTLDILYQVVGYGTDKMAGLAAGDIVEMIGPVGKRWSPPSDVRRVLLVGGGVGAAPLFLLAEELVQRGVETHIVLGASTEGALVCRSGYEGLNCESLACATDDGTYGRAGFCTSLVEEALAGTVAGKGAVDGEDAADGTPKSTNSAAPFDYMAACGPEPLMKICAALAETAGVSCEVSMERRMACGIGACLSCVVETTGGKRRACVDGPIFDAQEIVW